MKLVITESALADIEKAKHWYDKQQQNLGTRFANHIFKSINLINHQPLAYPVKYKFTREMYVKKYPYVIIYSIGQQVIFIIRLFACKRNPKLNIKKTKYKKLLINTIRLIA